ncbi:MAG: acyl-CoA thioesterase [Alphaproteobacteria bacterium]|nr:acyl-CoA thioesterase [Alphaproteobacteria bacterium]
MPAKKIAVRARSASVAPAGPPDLTDRRVYRHWFDEPIRFGDQDSLGHVNNASVATYCESARLALSQELGYVPGKHGIGWVLARIAIDYRAELHYPGTVNIGTVVSRLGTSSCTLLSGIFCKGKCAATAEAILVMINYTTRKSVPIPQGLRRKLAKLESNRTARR